MIASTFTGKEKWTRESGGPPNTDVVANTAVMCVALLDIRSPQRGDFEELYFARIVQPRRRRSV